MKRNHNSSRIRFFSLISCLIILSLFCIHLVRASAMKKEDGKKAIVAGFFGTSYPTALKAITNIHQKIKQAFPSAEVRIAFTSDFIKDIWNRRSKDQSFLKEHKDIPEEIFQVKSPLATIADLQNQGYKTIIVQSTHVYEGEEFADLASCIDSLNSIKTVKEKNRPFKQLFLGRPLLGEKGIKHHYHNDLMNAARAVNDDIALAKERKAALVYMGHGNEFYSTGSYIELQKTLRKMYQDVPIYIGTVEGFPSLDDVVSELKRDKIKKVLLKPFMIVAGDHACNDMAGDEEDSWKKVLEAHSIAVETFLQGLGEMDSIANIFIEHIKEIAQDNTIDL